jgi:predicted exporter
MWALIKTWLSGNALRLISWGVAALSVVAVLFGARQAGRSAERVDQLKKTLEIKDAQLRATLDAPRTRGELVDRLRDGKF